MSPYFPVLIVSLIACFGVQFAALKASGGRTTKSESNFFSSIGRIQAGSVGKADVMMLGSSITGRLPDRAQGFAGTANMGCDGGSAVDALRAMDEGILPIAPLLIIEANTLHMALSNEPTEIARAMRTPWFRVGMEVPLLSAYARPAAFLYSTLLARKIGGFETGTGPQDLGVGSLPALPTSSALPALTDREEELIREISAILDRLRAKGCEAWIVWLPPARKNNAPAPPWILELARRSHAPWWDLGQQVLPGTVELTDGVHMAAPSAARTMNSLLDGRARFQAH